MTAESADASMRTIRISDGPIDVRVDTATGRVCLVLEARDAQLRLFRVMSADEAQAFYEHYSRVVGKEQK